MNTYVLLGLVLIVLAIPFLMRKVKRNAIFGYRMPVSFKSEKNWYTINYFAAWVMVVEGILLLGWGLFGQEILPADTGVLYVTPILLAMLVLVVLPAIYAWRLRRQGILD